MKRKSLFCILSLSAIFSTCLCSCSNNTEKAVSPDPPLNITIYLDLSDRLTRELQPSQKDRDIAIVDKFIQIFKDSCIEDKILQTKNHIRVIFYPTPNSSEIATLSKALDVNMQKCKADEKRRELSEIDSRFSNSLNQIYDETITAANWLGSDIWGFFSNKKVDELCIRKGYRNILVILTDGFIYHVNNKQIDGNSYSYLLPKTLQNPESSLMVKRKGLEDLEVLMLEVNPYDPKTHDKMQSVLENWFREMGVKKFVVSETDLPINTATIIDNFMGL